MTKVSIIVPVYNTEKYLNKCIDSLINQTLKDIEIIIINDGSTDNSDNIIKSYKDSRIKYISKSNEGIGKTRNIGIDLAKGEYLAFVDSDDYIANDFCEKMYNKAQKDNCDVVICNFYKESKGLIKVNLDSFDDSSLQENPALINKINLGPCNKIYKKSLFDNPDNRFVENLKYEDAPFIVKILLSANKIGKLNDYLTYYVIHSNSQTTIRDENVFDILLIVDIIVNDLKKANFDNKEITNLVVMILTDYTIQQRYVKDSKIRNKFIDKCFLYLKKLDKDWKKCTYLKRFSSIKRIVKSNKILTKIYCKLYTIIKSI